MKRYLKDEGKIWRNIIDRKYIRGKPNIFACKNLNSSVFWQAVLWAARALKFSYRWVVVKGIKPDFGRTFGLGPLLCLSNFGPFTLSATNNVLLWLMFEMWYCLEQIILGTKTSDDDDALIWQYEANGEYST